MAVETVWYENTAEGSYHEVVKGTDTERRMRGELRAVAGDDGDETFEPAFRPCKAPAQSRHKDLPGYVAPDASTEGPAPITYPDAEAPVYTQEEMEAAVARVLEARDGSPGNPDSVTGEDKQVKAASSGAGVPKASQK